MMNGSHSMRWPWNPRWPPFDLETHLNGKSECQKSIQRPKKTQKTCIIGLSTMNGSHSMRWPWNPRWPPFDLETHLNGKSECQKSIQQPKKTQKTCIIGLSTMNGSHSMRWPWNPRWPPFDLETHLNGKMNSRNEFSDLKRPRKHVSYDFLRQRIPILWGNLEIQDGRRLTFNVQADRVGKNRFGFSTLGLGKKQQNKIAPRFEKRNSISRRRTGSGPRPSRPSMVNHHQSVFVQLSSEQSVSWDKSVLKVLLKVSSSQLMLCSEWEGGGRALLLDPNL